jgi:multifunctional methyltransferase subunit TRM112
MRLLTHNFLACLKCDTYPLLISATEVEEIPVEYDAEFTRRMLARIDYPSLQTTFHKLREDHASVLGHSTELPETMDGADLSDESEFVKAVHLALNVVAVKSGTLQCPTCKSTYTVNDFIPNFVQDAK